MTLEVPFIKNYIEEIIHQENPKKEHKSMLLALNCQIKDYPG